MIGAGENDAGEDQGIIRIIKIKKGEKREEKRRMKIGGFSKIGGWFFRI